MFDPNAPHPSWFPSGQLAGATMSASATVEESGPAAWLHSAVDTGSSLLSTGSNLLHRAGAARDWASHGITSAEHGITNAVHGGEDYVGRSTHALANRIGGLPLVGPLAGGVANRVADAATFGTQVLGGVIGGATTMVGGVANAALHPLDTAHGVEEMAVHAEIPVLSTMLRGISDMGDVMTGHRTLGSVWDRATNPSDQSVRDEDHRFWSAVGRQISDPYRQSIAQHRYGEALGRGIFDIGSMFLGAGEAGAAGRGGEIAGTVARVGDSADAARTAALADGARGLDVARTGEGGGDVARATGNVRPPNHVQQMPAVPADITPGMPQPPRWHAGPPGSGPSNPVMEMPRVDPADAAAGRMPRDWGAYSVGRGRAPGAVGEMPRVDPQAIGRGVPGLDPRAGRVSPLSSNPGAVPSAPAPTPIVPGGGTVDPIAPTAPGVNPFGATAPRVDPFGATAPRVDPFGATAPVHPVPIPPTRQTPLIPPTRPGLED